MKTKILILAFVWLMCGCESVTTESPDGATYVKSLIQRYCMPSEMYASQYMPEYVRIKFKGRYVDYPGRGHALNPEYEVLARKYNDLSYNNYVVGPFPQVLGTEYSAIKITCDKVFDEAHPVGESLGNVVKLCATSYKKFIASGYDHTAYEHPAEFNDVWWFENGFREYPVYKFLNEVTREDLILVEPEMYLHFTETPAAGEYEFTIEVLSDEADDLTAKVKMTF